MLAQNFMTGTDLGIAEIERDALVKVLHMLECGELEFAGKGHPWQKDYRGFNLGPWPVERGDCGTVGCFVGWSHIVDRRVFADRSYGWTHGYPQPFYDLIFGNGAPCKKEHIATGAAASALRNYLTTGDPRWAEVFAVNQ